MTVMQKQASYGITYGKDNPYVFGIACIIAGVALAIPLLFVLCLHSGLIQMSSRGVAISISMYAGLLTIALILAMTIPKFKQAANAVKITGKVVDSKDIINKHGHVFSPIVKYEYNGQTYTIELDSWSSKEPVCGSEMEIRINPKKPNKIVTKGELVFATFMLIIFTGMGIIFGSMGFLISGSDTQINTESLNSGDIGFFSIIWGGFIVFWLLLGIIICVVTKKRQGKQLLKETGIKTTCIIVDVTVNESLEINGENPVKLTCSADGKMYTVKTKTSSHKCNYRAGEKIDFYFDPNNSKKYFVDLKE
ncbi:MAG: DUF3592 domain-containing protein [Spirochaetaceae bacterium]|nr:DUF3592 domain-containing protein [Spirochaetaceae bacterium]